MAKKQQVQGECCYICGGDNPGYAMLLVTCAECCQLSVHKYCMGIIPETALARSEVCWTCPYCCYETTDPVSDNVSFATANVAGKTWNKQFKSEIILMQEEDPKPMCALFPEGHFKGTVKAEPAEIMTGVVLLVNPSGKIIIKDEDMSCFDGECSDCASYFTPPVINKASSNVEAESFEQKAEMTDRRRSGRLMDKLQRLDMLGFRRSPRFKRRKMASLQQACKGVAVC